MLGQGVVEVWGMWGENVPVTVATPFSFMNLLPCQPSYLHSESPSIYTHLVCNTYPTSQSISAHPYPHPIIQINIKGGETHIRTRQIILLSRERDSWVHRKVPALVLVEDPREDRGRVEVGDAVALN